MVLGDDAVDSGDINPQQGLAAAAKEDIPTNDSLELMESILQRLQPSDRHEIRDMITNRGWLSGVLLMMSGLFWWIAVGKGATELNNADIPLSLLGEFDFATLAMIVPGLVFSNLFKLHPPSAEGTLVLARHDVVHEMLGPDVNEVDLSENLLRDHAGSSTIPGPDISRVEFAA